MNSFSHPLNDAKGVVELPPRTKAKSWSTREVGCALVECTSAGDDVYCRWIGPTFWPVLVHQSLQPDAIAKMPWPLREVPHTKSLFCSRFMRVDGVNLLFYKSACFKAKVSNAVNDQTRLSNIFSGLWMLGFRPPLRFTGRTDITAKALLREVFRLSNWMR